jgi:hypothetical protein
MPYIILRRRDVPQQARFIMQLAPRQRIIRQLGQPGQGLLFGAHVVEAITPSFWVQGWK